MTARWLVCHPGSGYSTGDVYNGIVPQLRMMGVEVHEYDLESRLDISQRLLNLVWRQRGRPKQKYTGADVVYGASKDVLERALRWEVDGVLIFSAMFLHPDALVLLKRAGVRTALLLSESPYDDEHQAKILPWIDVAWTNERSSVRLLRKANPNVNYMPHAFNPAVHHPDSTDDPEVPAHDVVFVGSMFQERYELLSKVDWTGIDLGLYGQWAGIPGRSHLRQYVRGDVVDNRYAAALYRKTKIGLNLYRESKGWGKGAPRIDHAESMNPRTLELAACGCFQISQARAEITETFGYSIPTFSGKISLKQQPQSKTDAEELGHLIRQYLADPEARMQKAMIARHQVQSHTFAARARTIVDDLGRAGWPVPELTRELVAV